MRIHRHRQRKSKFTIPEYRVNEKIDVPEVRVVDENAVSLDVMPTERAIALARERGLDLIEVSPKANPPVCKFADAGHFKYQKEKEVRKQRAQSKEVETKGIRLSMRIGTGDLMIRVEQAAKFMERGDKVKAEMMLRGRERAHFDVAKEVFGQFTTELGKHYQLKVEQPLKNQEGKLFMVLARAS